MRVDHPAEIFAPPSYQDRTGWYPMGFTTGGNQSFNWHWIVPNNLVFLLEWVMILYSYKTIRLAATPNNDFLTIYPHFPQAFPTTQDKTFCAYMTDQFSLKLDYLTCFNPGSDFFINTGVERHSTIDAMMSIHWKGRTWDARGDWSQGDICPLPPSWAYHRTWEL